MTLSTNLFKGVVVAGAATLAFLGRSALSRRGIPAVDDSATSAAVRTIDIPQPVVKPSFSGHQIVPQSSRASFNYSKGAAIVGLAALAALGGIAFFRWLKAKPTSRDDSSSVLKVDEPVVSTAPLDGPDGVAMAAAKSEQQGRLSAMAALFFQPSLATITLQQITEFLGTAETFTLLSDEERSEIIFQQFLPKKDDAAALVTQLQDATYISGLVEAGKQSIQQEIKTLIARVRALRGPYGNDGEIHAAYTRGDMDGMQRLHKEYSYIGGGHFNPDININAKTRCYIVSPESIIGKLQQAKDSLAATVANECQKKAEFWSGLLSRS